MRWPRRAGAVGSLAMVLCLLLVHTALALSPADAGAMDADVRIVSAVDFVSEGAGSRVEDAAGTIRWYPRDDALQDVMDISVVPDGDMGADGFRVEWSTPDAREVVTIDARVRTRNAIVPVRSRIAFPLTSVAPELEPYLQPGAFTDTSGAITRQAQDLAAGKTDAYEVVFALADWTTRNVEYSLDSLRAPAIQRASQVMVSRHGKCDEITALFISMAREVGIPARFVAGYSYTESDLFSEPWGAHGWAEVWLPGAGWVPFDVTYGEYGYLDAGHVRMASSVDVSETSVSYEARGRDFRIEASSLDITVTPTDLDAHGDTGVRIALDAPRSRVGFGSAVLILATVTIDVLAGAPVYDEAEFADEIADGAFSPTPIKPDAFSVTCDRGDVVYVGEVATHTCVVGGLDVDQLTVCADDDCERIAVRENEFPISTTAQDAGTRTLAYTARVGGRETAFYVTTRALEQTQLRVVLDAPATVTPDDVFTLVANVSYTGAMPLDVDAIAAVPRTSATKELDRLVEPTTLLFEIPGKTLHPGPNNISLTISFSDEIGSERSETFVTEVELVDVGFWDHMLFLAADAELWLEHLFD